MTTTPIRPNDLSDDELEVEVVDLGVGVDVTAPWLFGLALTAATERTPDAAAISEIVAESDGNLRAIEGAYGRALALLGEFPDDPHLQETLRLLTKAMRHSALNSDRDPGG